MNAEYKNFSSLDFGSNDAVNYISAKKDLFKKLFFPTEYLNNICDPHVYFIIGEKGTGKTAYAVYLTLNEYNDTLSVIKSIKHTQYERFYKLKEQNKLPFSSFENIWTIILYLIILETIKKTESKNLNSSKLKALDKVINAYYTYSFAPEIQYAFELVENKKRTLSLLARYKDILQGEFGINKEELKKTASENYQMYLVILENLFKETIASLNIKKNYMLFIDGIDRTPDWAITSIQEWKGCLKGLVDSIMTINSTLNSIISNNSNIKVVLLARPDILTELELVNLNNIYIYKQFNSIKLDV